MRILPISLCIAATVLAACSMPSRGYYDTNGNYVSSTPSNKPPVAAPLFKKQGYYDSYGTFIPAYSGNVVPEEMFPPVGMCRVWVEGRAPQFQPPVESCDGILDRVPGGAYVIYGG